MFGINGGELLILLLVAALVVGPERLPAYAEQLAGWVRRLRDLARDAKERVDTELGDGDVDWAALDPRRYDPRRIVRDALLEPEGPSARSGADQVRDGGAGTRARVSGAAATDSDVGAGGPGVAPYDDEAT